MNIRQTPDAAGIEALFSMLRTMSNCLGDVAVSTIVAKSEGLLRIL